MMDVKIIKNFSSSQDKFKDFPMNKRKRLLKFISFICLAFLILLVIFFLMRIRLLKRESAEAAINQICEPKVVKEIIEKERDLRWLDYQAGAPFNLRFSYPEDWHILVNTDPEKPVSQYAKAAIVFSDKPIQISQEILNYPLIIEISRQTLTYKERSFAEEADVKKKISLDGTAAIQFSGINNDLHSKYKAVVFYRDKKVFVIYGLLNLGYNNYEEVLDRIVKTIRFIP